MYLFRNGVLSATRGALFCLAAALLAAGCTADTSLPSKPSSVASVDPVGDPDEGISHTAAGYYLAAHEAEQQGDRTTASKYMAEALALDPGNVDLLSETFRLDLSEGRFTEADRLAKRLVRVQPNSQLANLFLALEDIKKGRWAAAQSRMAKLPTSGLGALIGPIGRAWSLQGAGKTDEAVAALAPLSSVRGFAVLRELHKAFINDLAGRTAAAEASYKQSIESESKPSFRVVDAFANFYARHGRTKDALALLKRFKDDNPDTVRLDETIKALARGKKPSPEVPDAKAGIAEALFDIGSALREDTTDRLSLGFMRLALFISPEFTVARIALGDMLAADGRHDEALALYNKINRSNPLYFSARLRVATVLHNMNRGDDGIKELERLAATWPDRPDPLASEGDFLRASERFADAAKAYDRAIARIKTIDTNDWPLFYARGVALERSGQWPRAERDFLEALKLSPNQPSVLNYLGYSWVDRDEHLDRAKKLIERAVELKPDDGYIVDSLGWVLYRVGDFKRAVANLERAVALRPDDPVINDHLGDAYWRVGRLSEARFQWQRALSLKPEPDLSNKIGLKLEHGLKANSKPREHDS